MLAQLNAARLGRRAAVVVTELATGAQRLVLEPAGDPFDAEIHAALKAGRSRTVERPDGARAFLNVHVPPPRLVILGAVHVAQTLAPTASVLGYHVVVVDPRAAFATAERFPGVDVRAEWPDVALASLRLDAFTAFAALTHDPKIDDPGLIEALSRDCFYVGALGSRKTHAARAKRLAAAGLTPEAVGRIKAPIGLPIGAASPAEIAVAILAEITASLRLEEAA